MSTAANHKTRSRRGYYKQKAFYGRRVSVGTPTVPKSNYFDWFRMIRSGLSRGRESGSDLV